MRPMTAEVQFRTGAKPLAARKLTRNPGLSPVPANPARHKGTAAGHAPSPGDPRPPVRDWAHSLSNAGCSRDCDTTAGNSQVVPQEQSRFGRGYRARTHPGDTPLRNWKGARYRHAVRRGNTSWSAPIA